MGIFGLFRFFSAAKEYSNVNQQAFGRTRRLAPNQYAYQGKIVACGKIGGLIGFLTGAAVVYWAYQHPPVGKMSYFDIKAMLLAPFFLIVAGIVGGASWAGAFAPTAFLRGPVGARWLKFVGTTVPLVARVISFIVALIATAVFIAMLTFGAMGKV